MFNFLKKLESPATEEQSEGSAIVDNSYINNVENVEKIDYTALLNENEIEWKREDVEEAKNKFDLVKDKLPEDFTSKPYEERMDIVGNILESLN